MTLRALEVHSATWIQIDSRFIEFCSRPGQRSVRVPVRELLETRSEICSSPGQRIGRVPVRELVETRSGNCWSPGQRIGRDPVRELSGARSGFWQLLGALEVHSVTLRALEVHSVTWEHPHPEAKAWHDKLAEIDPGKGPGL